MVLSFRILSSTIREGERTAVPPYALQAKFCALRGAEPSQTFPATSWKINSFEPAYTFFSEFGTHWQVGPHLYAPHVHDCGRLDAPDSIH